MSSDGKLYDLDYLLVENYNPDIQQAQENGLHLPSSEIYTQFPDPNNSRSYSEYNQNVTQWYSQMLASIGKIKLPTIMGRAYYRPRCDLIDNVLILFFIYFFYFHFINFGNYFFFLFFFWRLS